MKTSRSSALLAACLVLPAHAFEPDVIIDANDHPSSVELSPAVSWTNEATVTDALRGASKVRNTVAGTDFARFHTTLPVEGPWQVYIWHNLGTATSVTATVSHADGDTPVTYGQDSGNSGQWMALGVFWFNTTDEAEVKITNATASTKLSADAVRFALVTPDIVVNSMAGSGVTRSPGNDWVDAVDRSCHQYNNIRRSNTSGATLTFQPTLPAAGDYDISLWLPPSSGTWLPGGGTAASSFTVDVHGRNGVVTNHTVTMPGTGAFEGKWVQVATSPFRFNATPTSGPNPYPAKVVVKTNGATGQWVPANAVRFTKVGTYELYVDNEDGSPIVTASPTTWGLGTALSARHAGYYRRVPFGPTYRAELYNSSYSSARSMTFNPAVPELGLYDVFLWSPGYGNYYEVNTSGTNVTIRTALGDVSRVVDQSTNQPNQGIWYHVGRHILHPSDDPDSAKRPWVKIATPTNPYYYSGYVVADAVLVSRDGEEVDADGDGLPDWHEVLLATSTSTADVNNDGIPDGWDTDNDGMSDGDEYNLGRNPLMTAANGSSLMSLQVHTPTFR